MDDDDDDMTTDDDLESVIVLPARPLSWLDLAAFTPWAAARALATASNIADEFSDLIAMHIGYTTQRRNMAEQAAREIEALTGGGGDG